MNKLILGFSCFSAGLLVAAASGGIAQTTTLARPGSNATEQRLAALEAGLASAKAEAAQANAKAAEVEKLHKNLVGQFYGTKNDLAKLSAAYSKHQHLADFTVNGPDGQKFQSTLSSQPTEFCDPKVYGGVSGRWSTKHKCG